MPRNLPQALGTASHGVSMFLGLPSATGTAYRRMAAWAHPGSPTRSSCIWEALRIYPMKGVRSLLNYSKGTKERMNQKTANKTFERAVNHHWLDRARRGTVCAGQCGTAL